MTEPTDNRTREEHFEHLARALALLRQKAGQAQNEKRLCSVTPEEAFELADELTELMADLVSIKTKIGPELLAELLAHDGDQPLLDAMQYQAYDGWRRSPFFQIYLQGAQRSAAQLKRPLFVLWHPSVQICAIWDAEHNQPATYVGWLVAAVVLADGSTVFAPEVRVFKREESMHVRATNRPRLVGSPADRPL